MTNHDEPTPVPIIMKILKLTWLAAMFAVFAARAEQEITLKMGDPAPKLQVSKWLQGDPVKEFEKDKTYIVEFWATWCGPCRVSIPHLNDIHNKFKDKGLIVIGQDVSENDITKVEPFVKKMGDKMTYRVALDLLEAGEKPIGKMSTTWMKAAGQGGIPTAFVVNKQGLIAWIGHPMALNDQLIGQFLDGTFDIQKAAVEKEKEQAAQREKMRLPRQLAAEMKAKQWDKAEATLLEIGKGLPENQRAGLDSTRFQILIGKADFKGAIQLAGKISDEHKDKAMLQNELAWQLATNEAFKERDLELAAKIASRANDAAKGKDPAILDTFARVTFMQGKQDKAIELQEMAVKLAEGEAKNSLQAILDSYKKGTLPKAD
jgi:thiol-disulfide isomerase/thioredoxin